MLSSNQRPSIHFPLTRSRLCFQQVPLKSAVIVPAHHTPHTPPPLHAHRPAPPVSPILRALLPPLLLSTHWNKADTKHVDFSISLKSEPRVLQFFCLLSLKSFTVTALLPPSTSDTHRRQVEHRIQKIKNEKEKKIKENI